MSDVTGVSGSYTLPSNGFTAPGGKQFAGWKAANTGDTLAAGASYTVNANVTFYAQWKESATEAPTTAPTEAPSGTRTIYFVNSRDWTDDTVFAYIWNDETREKNAEWGHKDSILKTKATSKDGHIVYQVDVDTTKYDHVIFASGSNQTVDIDLSVLLEQGNEVYLLDTTTSDHSGSRNIYNVGVDTYGETEKIGYSKKIERKDTDSYRLHLTVDGEALSSGTTVPGEPVKERKIGILMDVTETMLSTWSGSDSGDNKFDGVRKLLQGSDGFLNSILDGHTEVYIIVVGGQSGTASYRDLSDKVASGKTTGDFSNINNSLHVSQGISYVTGLKAAEYYLGNDIDSLVYIVGNETDTYVSYSTGNVERGTNGTSAQTKNYNDYVTFMTNHPNLSMYTVYVTPTNRGSEIAQKMGDYSVSRGTGGGYYEASDTATLKEKLTQISEAIQIPGDKTKDITVSDTLSAYVDFPADTNVTATLYTGDDLATTEDISNAIVFDRVSKTVTYTRASELTGPFKIEIAFDIKTADGQFAPAGGYTDIGYYDTDYYPSGTTEFDPVSSGQKGYYSNAAATLTYTLNDEQSTKSFQKPVVQLPVEGKYIFKYKDRYYDSLPEAKKWRSVSISVPMKDKELQTNGYGGNGGKAGVPTFLWNDASKAVYRTSPIIPAALKVQDDPTYLENVSVYKNDIRWNHLNESTLDGKESYFAFDADNHTVTFIADTTPKVFTFEYYVDGEKQTKVEKNIPYGDNVTFNELYKNKKNCRYIDAEIPRTSGGKSFSYWAADAAGTILLTTNITFGMVLRGSYAEDVENENVVTAYAIYGKETPANVWIPEIEEATLTRAKDDATAERVLYSDYMTNYFNYAGDVVQDMIAAQAEGTTDIRYGLIAVKAGIGKGEELSITQDNLKTAVGKMSQRNIKAAYLDSGKNAIAYLYEYDDAEHISNFNRTLYTLKSSTAAMEGKQLYTMAYITFDGGATYSVSAINSELVFDLTDTEL